MRTLSCAWIVVGIVAAVGCQRDPGEAGGSGPRAELGTERHDCRPGPAEQACDPGLVCLSQLCVRPPPADCTVVADVFASFDLGNYAEPDERTPVVAKYRTACEKALVSKEQGECVTNAHGREAAIACVPRMFPERATPPVGTTGSADCDAVATKIKNLINAQQATLQNDPRTAKYMAAVIDTMRVACVEDQWPDALKRCMLATSNDNLMNQACTEQMSPELQSKLQARVTTVMQQMTQQLTQTP